MIGEDRYRDPMTRRPAPRWWAIALIALSAVALVICVGATVEAGQVAPGFFWPTPEGSDVVLTKRQYESALAARQVGSRSRSRSGSDRPRSRRDHPHTPGTPSLSRSMRIAD